MLCNENCPLVSPVMDFFDAHRGNNSVNVFLLQFMRMFSYWIKSLSNSIEHTSF